MEEKKLSKKEKKKWTLRLMSNDDDNKQKICMYTVSFSLSFFKNCILGVCKEKRTRKNYYMVDFIYLYLLNNKY
jgi:hypothetical protein